MPKYRWWTVRAGSTLGGHGCWFLKLGPATVLLYPWFDARWVFEFHWLNNLVAAFPDWRKEYT